eukprot:4856072-Prymnesium_polylepis.1
MCEERATSVIHTTGPATQQRTRIKVGYTIREGGVAARARGARGAHRWVLGLRPRARGQGGSHAPPTPPPC